jgi:hypothetical protein
MDGWLSDKFSFCLSKKNLKYTYKGRKPKAKDRDRWWALLNATINLRVL